MKNTENTDRLPSAYCDKRPGTLHLSGYEKGTQKTTSFKKIYVTTTTPKKKTTFVYTFSFLKGPPWWLRGQSICLQCGRPGFDPWVRKTPWRRAWKPTPIFLPGESHGQRSLVGYSPQRRKELDTNERPHLLSFFQFSDNKATCKTCLNLSITFSMK